MNFILALVKINAWIAINSLAYISDAPNCVPFPQSKHIIRDRPNLIVCLYSRSHL